MRTKSALAASEVAGAPFAATRGLALGSNTDRPRSTSKSGLNDGFDGTRDNAEAISCCSSGDGAQTLSMCTFTCGFGGALASCAEQRNTPARMAVTRRIFRNTAEIVTAGDDRVRG